MKAIFNLKYLVLHLTNRCNIACKYCYCPVPEINLDMTLEIMKQAVKIAASQRKRFHVQITGGEPCLNKELVFKTIEEVQSVANHATIAIQTNATLLDDEFAIFFKKHEVNIGISIDGPPSVHEKTRGMFAKMFAGLECLERCKVPWRATAVICVHSTNQLHRLVLMISRFNTARGIALDVLTRKGNALKNSVPQISPEAVRTGIINMMKTLEIVNFNRNASIRFREADSVAKHAGSGKTESFCYACLGESMAIYPDGKVYPCSQLCGEEKYCAGSIGSDIDISRLHLKNHSLISDECISCELKGMCPGDCPSRLLHNGQGEHRIVCEIYRTIYDYQKRNKK